MWIGRRDDFHFATQRLFSLVLSSLGSRNPWRWDERSHL